MLRKDELLDVEQRIHQLFVTLMISYRFLIAMKGKS